MRLYKLFVSLLTLAAAATAHAGLPSSVGKARQVLTITQKVSAAGEASVSAKVAPLVNATAGFGTTVLRTDVRVPTAIGSLQTLTFPGNATSKQILDTATAHFNTNGKGLAVRMQGWMQANGVSFAWFSYEQTVNVWVPQYAGSGGASGGGSKGGGGAPQYNTNFVVANPASSAGTGTTNTGGLTSGYEERLLLWTMSTDQNGRLMFGKPKLVPPRPKTLYVVYTPLAVDDSLPGDARYPNAGTLFVQTRDEAFQAIPGTDEYINANGAFDEAPENLPLDDPTTPDIDESLNFSGNIEYASKVACLMTTGCGAKMPDGTPMSVRQLMDARGATLAIVEYVHKIKPAYPPVADAAGNYQPLNNRLVIDKRTVTYNGCNDPVYYNKGHYGFSLRTAFTRYIVSSDGQYAPIAEEQGEAIAITPGNEKYYEGSVTVKSADIGKLADYVINPVSPTSSALVPWKSLPLTDALAALETTGDSNPVSIYRTTGQIGTGNNTLSAHVFLKCSADSPLIQFSAGWQDYGVNTSVNWQLQVNRYTAGTTFERGKPAIKGVWTRENPDQDVCYGTAAYDGKQTVSLNMSGTCRYGAKLLHGNVDPIEFAGGDFRAETGLYGYLENGLGSLFPPATCPSGTVYGSVYGGVWGATTDNDGTVYKLAGQTLTGCLYDSRVGLRIPLSVLLRHGPLAAGSGPNQFGDYEYWDDLGVCPSSSDRPVFTAVEAADQGEGSTGESYLTARTCVMKPQSTYTVSW